MRYVVILILSLVLTDPIKIRKINSAKAEAKAAFQSGDYAKAAATYRYLVDSLGVNEDEVLLNLAHAYYLQKDTANAYPNYQSLMSSSKGSIVSKADLHVGLMANQRGKAEEALALFKQAVKADPTNEEARYNYEMLKKKLDEQKKKEQEQQKRDQQNKDQDQKQDQQNKDQQQKDKEQQEKEQEKKEQDEKQKQEQQKKEQEQKEKEKQEKEQQEQEQQEKEEQEKQEKPNLDQKKLEQMKITEEKARMILEAMRNQEKQYLQQNKRKATKSRDRSKPDW
jgi:Ca-activated chloride channel family protein